MIVEPELAARAAERATTEDFVSLRRAIAAMENCRTNQERLEADLAFHQCIFRASGNRICHLLFNVIHRSVLTSMSKLSTRVPLDRPLTFHKRIFAPFNSVIRRKRAARCLSTSPIPERYSPPIRSSEAMTIRASHVISLQARGLLVYLIASANHTTRSLPSRVGTKPYRKVDPRATGFPSMRSFGSTSPQFLITKAGFTNGDSELA